MALEAGGGTAKKKSAAKTAVSAFLAGLASAPSDGSRSPNGPGTPYTPRTGVPTTSVNTALRSGFLSAAAALATDAVGALRSMEPAAPSRPVGRDSFRQTPLPTTSTSSRPAASTASTTSAGGPRAGAATVAAPTPPGGSGGGTTVPPWQASIEDAKAAAAAQADALEAQFQRDKAELAELFQFAETDAEKKRLADLLGRIEQQRVDGLEAIKVGYDDTVKTVTANAAASRQQGQVEAQAMGDLFRAAALELAGQQGPVADDGLGSNIGGTTGADPYIALLQAAAPREQALSQQLGNLTADDQTFLADTLRGESAAKQADLDRLALALAAETEASHGAQVQARIGQERSQYAGQLASLLEGMRNRGLDLSLAEQDAAIRLAELQQREAESAAQRAHEVQLQREQIAAAAARGGGGGGGAAKVDPLVELFGPEVAATIKRTTVFGDLGPVGVKALQEQGVPVPSSLIQPQTLEQRLAGLQADKAQQLAGGLRGGINLLRALF